MKTFKIIILFTISLSPFIVNAQNDIDALRYSMTYFGGTTRNTTFGGAFGAIGADFSTISVNPAGLGVYRKNEITFTPSIYTGKTHSTYNGASAEDMKYNFNISNIGLVFALNKNQNTDRIGWKTVNFAFGLNRNNNFYNNMNIGGKSEYSSLMDVYCDAAQGSNYNSLDAFSTQLAFNTYLIDTNGIDSYFSNVPSGILTQNKSVETKGAIREMVFAIGGNYNDKFFIGGTLGFPYIKYYEQSTYRETNEEDTINNFKNFNINEDIATSGAGINFKFGLIYMPIDFDIIKVKVGAAIHSPTFFNMHDRYSKTISSSFKDGNYTDQSPHGVFDYELTTPMKAIGSVAFQIGQYGMIGIDYEFIDYSDARLRSNSYKFYDENNNIEAKYTANNNIRIGGELVFGQYSIRGGYAIYGSPYKSGINDGKRTFISGGFGIIDKDYFIDFGYIYSTSHENYYLYNIDNISPVSIDKTYGNFLVTIGIKY